MQITIYSNLPEDAACHLILSQCLDVSPLTFSNAFRCSTEARGAPNPNRQRRFGASTQRASKHCGRPSFSHSPEPDTCFHPCCVIGDKKGGSGVAIHVERDGARANKRADAGGKGAYTNTTAGFFEVHVVICSKGLFSPLVERKCRLLEVLFPFRPLMGGGVCFHAGWATSASWRPLCFGACVKPTCCLVCE